MSDLPGTPGFYPARPSVTVDGTERPELADGLLSLLAEETVAGLYRCEMTVGNWGSRDSGVGFLYFDRDVIDFGTSIEVRMGAGETAGTVFAGKVTGIEGRYPQSRPPEVTILAEDRLQDLRMTRRTRTFADVTDEDVFRDVAAAHSLAVQIDVDATVTHRVLAQVNQSDLAFLRERARAIDAELWVEGESLHVAARGRRSADKVSFTYGRRLHEFSVLADLAGQRTSLGVSGWDVSAKESIDVEVDESAVREEITDGVGGATVLRDALGERVEQVVHATPASESEARAEAEAYYRRGARRFVTGTGSCEGDGRVRVGTYVDLQGLGTLFSGPYYVAEVRHLFEGERGYRTQFRVERPWLGA